MSPDELGIFLQRELDKWTTVAYSLSEATLRLGYGASERKSTASAQQPHCVTHEIGPEQVWGGALSWFI
jgi:hypothetical protein